MHQPLVSMRRVLLLALSWLSEIARAREGVRRREKAVEGGGRLWKLLTLLSEITSAESMPLAAGSAGAAWVSDAASST